jgi:hypothetical protein
MVSMSNDTKDGHGPIGLIATQGLSRITPCYVFVVRGVGRWTGVVLLLTSCGRVGFDVQSVSDGGDADATVVDADADTVDSGVPGPCDGAPDEASCPGGFCLDETCVPPAWAAPIGGPGTTSIGTDVSVDSLGNVYATIRFDGPIAVGTEAFDTNGGDDILVVSYDRAGTLRWARHFGGPLDDSSWSLAVGPDDNLYVGASVRDAIDLGFGETTGGGSGDNAVLSFEPDGTARWSLRVADSGFGSAGDIGFDRAGNVYFAGTFFGTADFGGGPVSSSSADGYDGKIWGLTPEGDYRFFAHWGDTGTSATRGVAVDSAGNLFFAMLLVGTVDIGGGLLTSPPGDNEPVFGSIDPMGMHRWSYSGGGGGLGQNVAVDADDNVYCAGQFDGDLDLGGLTATSAGCNDGLLASFTSAGSPRWIVPFDSARCDIVREAMVAPDQTIWVAGTVGDVLDVGGGMLPNAGGEDIIVAHFTNDGNHLWSTTIGGSGADDSNGIALGPNGDVLVAGSFDGPVDFGQGLVTPAARDAYIIRLNPRLP